MELLVGSSAVLVSVVAVVVGVYSAWIDRSFMRAATWPYVEVYRSYTGETMSYGVGNQGLGPAKIGYVVLEHEGRRYSTWREWLEAEYSLPKKGYVQSHISTRVLTPEQQMTIFTTPDADVGLAIRQNDVVNIEICYCSVFDECWLTDRENKPESIAACEVPLDTPFKQ